MPTSNVRFSKSIRLTILALFLPAAFLALLLFAAAGASPLSAAEMEQPAGPSPAILVAGKAAGSLQADAAAQVVTPTNLSVAILSTPWAVLDSNNPGGTPSDPAPNVFMVEAVVTNTGDYDAVDLEVYLDYNEDPANDWTLLPNETPLRTPAGDLAPGEAFYAYWFATYPITVGQSHQYTVSAWSEGVSPVSTSSNYFGDPAPGATVATDSFLSTGNSGVTEISADIVVGVAYTITVSYDLGTNPQYLILSPAGNPNFDAGSTRLLASSVRLYNGVDPAGTTIHDRLYLPSIPDVGGSPPQFAEVTYTLLPVIPASTEICSFAAIGYASTQKYDQFYCDPNKGTIFNIEGALSFSMTKQVDAALVQQDGILTYTIHYTNNGSLPLQHVWVWDDLDPAIASVISGTAAPAHDPDESTAHRVAWFLGDVAAAGQPGDSGTLTFQAVVDGAGLDLPDETEVLNKAFFGVNPGSLPPLPALTATVSSAVQAPTINITKSDGLDTIGNGETMTYTVNVANSGSVAATNLVLTDVLPAGVSLAGPASPPANLVDGQTLVWDSLPDLAPGQTLTATIPVLVSTELASFLDLVNTAQFEYSNAEGYTFDLQSASDTTTVLRRAGFVDGYAFIDDDGDGVKDAGETPLDGVQITLPSALTPITTTNSAGYYRFRVEVEQPISVTAGLPAGYFRTTPSTVYLENTFNQTRTVNFGYATTTSPFGVLYGTVFADDNHDGDQAGGESGLPGVTISATAAFTSPVLTGDYGIYTLRFDDPGPVTVQETNPAGYVSTTPDLIQTEVITGSDNGSPLNFGDFLGIRIEGKVFDDLNVNGQDDGEPGVAGAQVTAGSDSLTTIADGLFTLYARVPGGPILVGESDPAGYVSTDAVPGAGMSRVDANSLQIDSPVAGTVYQGGLFGDILASAVITISGEVWDDNGAGGGLAANGQRDGAEPGLAGVWLSASSGMMAQSDDLGFFTLYAPPGVPVTVTEQNPDGYVSTNAIPGNDAQKIDNDNLLVSGLSAGQSSTGNQFGDVQETAVASFSGAVWNDNGANGAVANDGLWQVGLEQPLAGAVVSLSSGMTATTGLDGAYLLFGPPGAAITITEQNPAGYVSSGASAASAGAVVVGPDTIVVAAPAAGQPYPDNNFGDLLPADLTIQKLDDPDPLVAGTLLTYTLNLANDGPSYAQSVVISDVLPAGVTFAGVLSQPAELSGPTVNDSTLTWEAAGLDNGFSGSIVFQVTAAPSLAQGQILTNSASLTSNMPDLAPGSNSATAETTVERRADLSITKGDDPDPVVAGESLTYVLQAGNHGPSDASSVLVTDTLPAAASFVSYQASQGTFDETSGVWSLGDLALDASATLTLVVDVASNAPVSLTNAVDISAVENDPNDQNDSFSQETAVIRQVDLSLSKSDSPDPVVAGESLTYVLEVSNNGPSDATGVSVTDTLPAEVGFVSYQASQGTFDDASGLWDVGGLALDASATLTIVVDVDSNAPVSLTNTAVATAEQPELNEADNTAVAATDVIRRTDLAIAKTATPDPVAAGVTLTYTLVISNDGPSDATGVSVTDVLPDSVTYLGDTASQGDYDPGAGLWTVGDLADGAGASLEIVVEVKSGATVSVTNAAAISGDQVDPLPDNNQAQVTTAITTIVDLAIGKSDDPDPATAGQQLTYSLQVDNNGPSDASGVSVTDVLPDGLTYNASGASQGSYNPASGVWTIGVLSVGQSASLTITADIDPGLTGTITNTAAVGGDQFDPNQDDNQVDQTTEIIAVADVALQKSDSPDPVTAGTLLTYVVEIQNLGPSDATGVSVSDPLAAGLTFQGAVASQGAYSPTTGLWDVGLLPLNQAATLTITVQVDSDQLGSVANTATVSADPLDPVAENDSATVSTAIESSADLAISKADAPDPVPAGGVVTYTLSYQNLGPSDALAVSIVDTLSEDVTFLAVVEEDPAMDSFAQDGQQLTWNLSPLAASEGGSIVFTVRVAPDAIGAVFNDVAISSETDDPVPDNNTAQSETAIGSPDQATIYGYVYADLNINGQFDPAEAGIAGVQVWLDDTYSTTTAADGLFFFITDEEGAHKVTEVDPEGYFSTTANKRVVSVSLGTSKRVDFGDAPDTLEAAAIFGTVFNDSNSNGLWEDLEGGLPGVTVTLDSAVTAVTDIYGGYTFSVTVTGTHTLVETDPPYYFSTTPNTAEVDVEFGNGYEQNFGDVRADIATCDPDPYEDDDVVGDATALTVGETRRHDFCDDAVDWTVFSARAGFIYTITTSSFDWRVDTNIALIHHDGQTLIAANDDLVDNSDFSSSLTWQANENEDYYIRTSNMAAVTGRHTDYDLTIEAEPHYIRFVPIITIPAEADKDILRQKPLRHAARLEDITLPEQDGGAADDGAGPLGIITHSCPDAYEVDDTWQTAFMVDDGDVQVHSFDSDPVLWAADKDYLGFMLLPHQSITFTISAVTNTDTFLEAFDHQGNSLGITGTNQLVLTDMEQGHYFISVSPLNASGYGCADEVGYEITVDKSPRWAMNVPIIMKP